MFKENEMVTLVLKSYFMNPDNSVESNQMKEMIGNIKRRLYLPSFPKILLISSLLSREQILSLHKIGDCYVSLHRCEGFGIPIVEAMAAGKPVIASNTKSNS
jgi:glycosyltransferase involved in cell wall biosynthesis